MGIDKESLDHLFRNASAVGLSDDGSDVDGKAATMRDIKATAYALLERAESAERAYNALAAEYDEMRSYAEIGRRVVAMPVVSELRHYEFDPDGTGAGKFDMWRYEDSSGRIRAGDRPADALPPVKGDK